MSGVGAHGSAAGRLFPARAFSFYADLAEHNDREWFAAHRAEYDESVRLPLERIAEWAEPRFGPAKVFRPNRDVRFSADKAPYKLNGAITAGAPGGVYVSVSAQGLVAGGGLYEPSREQLARAREAIADDGPAAARLESALAELDGAGFELVTDPLRTAPRGFPRDHPEIDLLRLTRFAALRSLDRDATRADLEGTWGAMAPLLDWVARFAGPGT